VKRINIPPGCHHFFEQFCKSVYVYTIFNTSQQSCIPHLFQHNPPSPIQDIKCFSNNWCARTAKTLKFTINEKRKEGKSFMWAAHDFGAKPATLSRWVAGMGPLYEEDIRKLAVSIGILTYITLGFPMPDDTYQENSQ
jgi:hypothetical protein